VKVWLVIRNDGYESWHVVAAYSTAADAKARARKENASIPDDPGDRFPNWYVLGRAIEVDPMDELRIKLRETTE
jgi:hypothetical protein